MLVIKKKQNKIFYYKFFTDRLEYRNTFFGKKVNEIKYENFKEIKCNQGFIQSKFNLGEIWILTNSKNLFKRMLIFRLIPNVKTEYEKIVKIFNS